MTLHADGAGRHNLSPQSQSQRGTRSRRGVDAPQEEGDAAEPENSDGKHISGGDGDGDDGGAEGGDDDVSGPDAATAPGEKLRADQAEISQLPGDTLLMKDVTWTVVEFVGDVGEVDHDVLQSGRDVFEPGISVEREIDAFTHMLWMDIPKLVAVINQASLREAAGRWNWSPVSARELGVWFGLLLGSLQFVERGNALWDSKYDTMSRPDFKRRMALTRFKNICKYVTATMAKYNARDTDAWWPLRGGVERFNAKRRALLSTVPVCVLDESMSAWG